MSNYSKIITELQKQSDPARAKHSQRFFKTGPGEYGEGDKFAGITMPKIRKIVRLHRQLSLPDTLKLLKSPIHDYRMTALLIMVDKYQKGDLQLKKTIYQHYIQNIKYINNWDLVDVTAPHIVGNYLLDHPRDILRKFAESGHLWKQRISVVATFAFIKQLEFKDTLLIAKLLLHHQHDLIHKAVGWMLREIGKKDQEVEEKFLQQYYQIMPRTMLRYAIERFPEPLRQKYLRGKIKTIKH